MSNVLIITGDQASLLDLHKALQGDPHVKAEFSIVDKGELERWERRMKDAFEHMEAKLLQTEKLMNLAREASQRDLEAKRAAEAKLLVKEGKLDHCPRCGWLKLWGAGEPALALEPSLESRAGGWVCKRLGEGHTKPVERAARVFEEACEFAQAADLPKGMARRILRYVYTRKPGVATAEAASVAVTLMAWLWFAGGCSLRELASIELDRIEALPQEKIDESLKRKIAAGIVTVEQPKPEPNYDKALLDVICKLEDSGVTLSSFVKVWQRVRGERESQ